MRQPEQIEEELFEIGGMADDSTKLEQIIAWCATHPDEVPFALHLLLNRSSDKRGE
ncbi:MAG TPA: hypothetical protein VG273_10155 [Bryobacteraceae bacterium]|jgi:hypothetical protein|nr:hypothetical protein [Bryobacteraceae bacterium]